MRKKVRILPRLNNGPGRSITTRSALRTTDIPGRDNRQKHADSDRPSDPSPESLLRSVEWHPEANLPLAVSPADAGKLAGIGRSTLYLALGSGELPSIKIGKRRLIMVEAIRGWLLSHQVTL